MKKIGEIYSKWSDKIALRRENVHRMIELKRLKRVRRKYTPPYAHCQNCGTKLEGMYCHNCGQFAHDNSQPFWKYIWQYFENVYQLDSKIPVTIWQLFRRPGFLTNEFNAGKIASYMHPLKLNMFILVIFFTIVIFMGEKMVDKQFTQANIPGYISQNIELDPQYFTGRDTTIFFIGNSYLLEYFPQIFTIEKRLSGKHSTRKLRPADIPEVPEVAKRSSGFQFENSIEKMDRQLRESSIYSYEDEQTGHDTILLTLPAVFLRDGIVVEGDRNVPDALFKKAGIDKNEFGNKISPAQLNAIAGAIGLAAASSAMDSTEIEELRMELSNTSVAWLHKVTPDKRYTRIDNDNAIKRGYIDELLAASKAYLPLVILLTIPFLAIVQKLVYRKKKMNYMAHFVFSLHFCAAMFILLFIAIGLLAFAKFIPQMALLRGFLLLLLLYFIIASHTVYTGTGWMKSILKSLFVLFLYLLGLTILLSILFILFIVGKAGV